MSDLAEIDTRDFFGRNGFAIFRNVIPHDDIDRLIEKIGTELRAYPGSIMRDSGRCEVNEFQIVPETQQRYITNSLGDPHLIAGIPELAGFRTAVRKVYFHKKLARCLRSLDGCDSHIGMGGALFFVNPNTEV